MTITVTVSNTTFTQLRNKVNEVVGVVNTLGTGNVSNTYLQATFATKAYAASNTAVRLIINDRLQVANAAATYQTKAIERAALANTNARINLLNTNLTGTNTALRAIDAQKLSVANATTLFAAKASWSGLISTNNALRILISDRLQVANANNKYATKAYAASNVYVKSILANTNAYIADVQAQIAAANEIAQDVIDYGFITSSVDVDTLRDYGTL